MQDFPANSKQAKATEAPREKLTPVTSADVGRRKRGLGQKFKSAFFSGSPQEAVGHMVEDVVVPAIRDTLFEALQSGLNHLIFGDRAPGKSHARSSFMSNTAGHVAYDAMNPSSKPKAAQQRMLSRGARARHDLAELVIPSRIAAEEVIDRMFDILSVEGVVSVAQLYELTGVRAEHTDLKWGWTNLRGAKPVRNGRGGFLLNLPEPEALA